MEKQTVVLTLWIGFPSTNIYQGRSTWPCHTSSAISQRNPFQLFTSTRISSSLICIDHTILQLSPHTFKVVQILQYYIVWTDRLKATSSPAPWWNPVAVACLKYRVIRNHMWLILYYILVSCDVHARISYVKHHIPCKQCFTFYHNRAGKCYTKATNNHHIQIYRWLDYIKNKEQLYSPDNPSTPPSPCCILLI